MLAERITSPAPICPRQNCQLLWNQASPHASTKTPGIWVPNEFLTRAYAPSSIFIPCVFMVLQIPLIATPLLSHPYKTGGVRGRPASTKMEKRQAGFQARKMKNLQGGTRLPTASHLSTEPNEATNVSSPRCDRGNR